MQRAFLKCRCGQTWEVEMPPDLPFFYEITCPSCGEVVVRLSIPQDNYPFGWNVEVAEGGAFELEAPEAEEE